MKTAYIMVALPRSGKSTFLNFLDNPEFGDTVFVYSTDNYIDAKAKELGFTYEELWADTVKEAEKAMKALLAQAIEMGVDIYWDQTNVSKKIRASALSKIPANYKKECICILPPRDHPERRELEFRIENASDKRIPYKVMFDMMLRWETPSLDEGFDRICFYDIFGNLVDDIS